MITGLHCEFSSNEIQKQLWARAKYHSDKAIFYRDQSAALTTGMEANPGASNDPISSLRRSQVEHENKAAYFQVLADHIIPNETYRLGEADLTRLELFSRFF